MVTKTYLPSNLFDRSDSSVSSDSSDSCESSDSSDSSDKKNLTKKKFSCTFFLHFFFQKQKNVTKNLTNQIAMKLKNSNFDENQ